MRYRIPYYYKRFSCTGSACEDTCCGGWRIGIDDRSYCRYQQVPGEFGRRLRRAIDPRDHSFVQKNRACTLLDEQGLCEIYKELGRDQMCDTCRNYPRHREDYGGVQELMLSLSCPEAARLILTDPSQGAYVEKQREKGPSEAELFRDAGVREEILSCLEEARQAMACILKDRTIPWNQRLAMMLAYAHDLQRHWDRAVTPGACRAAVRKCSRRYLGRRSGARFSEKLLPFENRPAERMSRMAAWMRCLQDLEPVLAHWESKQGAVCTGLYHRESVASYQKLERRFEAESQGLEHAWENLALYFLRTFFLGAVYDGDLYGKGKLVAASCLLIREWCLFRYRVSGQVTEADLVGAAYRYSREVENSDRNLERLEELLAENPLFSLSSMLTVLCGGEVPHGN